MIWDEHYLQHEYLSGRLVDVKLGLVRSVRVDALSGQEVDDVLRSVLVAVRGRHLEKYHQLHQVGLLLII